VADFSQHGDTFLDFMKCVDLLSSLETLVFSRGRPTLFCSVSCHYSRLIAGCHCDVDEICALLGYYAASCVKCLPTFRDNVSVPSSWVKSPSRNERKPATYDVDSIRESARGVAISRRDDSQ
jgi:hypothetical protein